MIFWSKKFGDFYYEREIWKFSCIIQVINRQWIMSLNYCIIFFFFMLNLLNCWTLEIENANSMANNVRVVGCDWFKFLQIFPRNRVFSLILIKSSSVGSLYSTIDLDFNYMFFFFIANLREKYVIFYTFSHSHYFFSRLTFLFHSKDNIWSNILKFQKFISYCFWFSHFYSFYAFFIFARLIFIVDFLFIYIF